jgi:phage terminase small subunit
MTPRQQKALAALLTSPSRAAAAEAAGITTRTLQNYLSDPEFQREYKRAFEGVVVDATRQAQQAISPALSTLRELVEDREEDAQARISAARAILSHGIKLTETTDILNRLQELETAMEGGRDVKY